MKIIADQNIPYLKDALQEICSDVIYLPGKEFTNSVVKEADVIIIRTRTNCNEELLRNSKVKFIGSATIGFDHIDTKYCKKNNIFWTNAPGCNSKSVAQYIQSSLLLIEEKREQALKDLTLGIIGVGNVGKAVAKVAKNLNIKVLLNDPIREKEERSQGFEHINTIIEEADIITFHTPLTLSGEFKTFHLGNSDFFEKLKKRPTIINTSRGEVIDTKALIHALDNNNINEAVIDVWENEPNINLELLHKTLIGTPHIAGYSADGKAKATEMILNKLCNFFKLDKIYKIEPLQPENKEIIAKTKDAALLKIYNPLNDARKLKTDPTKFESIRGNYPLRREEKAYNIRIAND